MSTVLMAFLTLLYCSL